MAETRPKLGIKPKPQVPVDERIKLDVERLMEMEEFHRLMFTIFQLCGMYRSSFHSADAVLAFGEGRRSLGLDILRTLEQSSDDAHIRILRAGQTLQEAPNGRRTHDRSYEPDDGDPGADDRRADDASVFLDYGSGQ